VQRNPSSRSPNGISRSTEHRPYRLGSADATVQMVIFFDYQSALCQRLEPQLRQLVGLQGDKVAVTLRHFPLCADCNHAVTATQHPNACRAARAVETAGLLGGAEGFWRMHKWMLTQRGRFTDEQLRAALDRLGHDDAEAFIDTMNGPEPLRAILADVVEAQTKGVRSVPTIVTNKLKVAGQKAEIAVLKALTAARQDASQSQADKSPPTEHTAQIALPKGFARATVTAAVAATVRLADDQDRPVGSGVVVGTRRPFVYVLTARHLVPRSGSLRIAGHPLAATARRNRQPPIAAVVARCQFADLALLRFSGDLSANAILPICPLRLVRDERSFQALSVGCDRGPPTTQIETVLARKMVRIREGSPATSVWEVQGDLAAGRSGGPLVDRRGYLLGVATGTAGGKGYFTDIRAIHRFLDEQGFAWLHEAKDGM
jgi:protein-disulfide isomerase